MKAETKKVAGYIIISVPTIIYGGYFLLTVLIGAHNELALTEFQKRMFVAGHAHAGVLVILSLIALIFIDETSLSDRARWLVRILFPLSAILVSAGFFLSATGDQLTKPNDFIYILYAGALSLCVGLVMLGVGLIRKNS